MKGRWLDFQQIKRAIPLGAVLRHYGWRCVRRHGGRLQGRCPIHRGQRADAFHVDLRQNGFHCFACQAHGDVLSLVAAMERCSLRQAALWLAERFGVESPGCGGGGSPPEPQRIREKETARAPLRFTLRPVDSRHAYLKQRGIGAETAAAFGAGYYAGPGGLAGRLVIPVHDAGGQRVAYAGRAITGQTPKYKLPAGFPKSQVLFNLHRAVAHGARCVIVVEGFFGCMKVHQAGQPSVVALMGCCLSAAQEDLLVRHFERVVLMLDGDPAGRQASHSIAARLMKRCRLDVVWLSDGQQPDRMSSEEIQQALPAAVRADYASSKSGNGEQR
jgi:DNA primase